MTLQINSFDLDVGLCNCIVHKLYKPVIKPTDKNIFLKVNNVINVSNRKEKTLKLFISYILGGFNYKSVMDKPFTNYLFQQTRGKEVFIVSGTHGKGMFLFLYIENKSYITCKISTPEEFITRIMN